jgi:hypothetical protein
MEGEGEGERKGLMRLMETVWELESEMGRREVENCIEAIIERGKRWLMTITANKDLRSGE